MARSTPAPSTRSAGDIRASVSPNSVGDQPTNRDALGFEPYVQAVAAFLIHKETLPPLTLSVEGAWGSGKSSFMLQLEEQLKVKGGITVWFNAWRHDRNEELWAAFALHFTNELARTVPSWKKWLLHVKLAYLRFDWRRGWFPLAKFVLISLFAFVTVSVSQYWFTHQSSIKQLLVPQHEATTDKKSQTATPPKWDELLFRLLLVLLCY